MSKLKYYGLLSSCRFGGHSGEDSGDGLHAETTSKGRCMVLM